MSATQTPVPDFLGTWRLTRGRFLKEIEGLSQEQLNWRLHPAALTIGEMSVHVAGTELSFCHQLLGRPAEGHDAELVRAATDGVVNDKPVPFSAE